MSRAQRRQPDPVTVALHAAKAAAVAIDAIAKLPLSLETFETGIREHASQHAHDQAVRLIREALAGHPDREVAIARGFEEVSVSEGLGELSRSVARHLEEIWREVAEDR